MSHDPHDLDRRMGLPSTDPLVEDRADGKFVINMHTKEDADVYFASIAAEKKKGASDRVALSRVLANMKRGIAMSLLEKAISAGRALGIVSDTQALASDSHSVRCAGEAGIHRAADAELERTLVRLKNEAQEAREAAEATKVSATAQNAARRLECEKKLTARIFGALLPPCARIGENPRAAAKSICDVLRQGNDDCVDQLGQPLDDLLLTIAFAESMGRPLACGNSRFVSGIVSERGSVTAAAVAGMGIVDLTRTVEALEHAVERYLVSAPEHYDTLGEAAERGQIMRSYATNRGRALALEEMMRKLTIAQKRADADGARLQQPIGEVQTVGGAAKPMRDHTITVNDSGAWK